MIDFIESVSNISVFALKGNHDTNFYEERFGSPNYLVYSEAIINPSPSSLFRASEGFGMGGVS